MKKLFYMPLEPYVERYTYFMSSPGGWAETNFKELGIDFYRVDGNVLGNTINTGKVLDACGRSYFAATQISKMIKLLNEGAVKDGDVIYAEDFWHPGIESLFYIRALTGIKFTIGTFLHAQSVDDTDFTYEMRDWMRPIEIGYGKGFDHIMVTSEILKNLCVSAGIGTAEKIHNIGLPYNSKRLLEQLYEQGFVPSKKTDNSVIFSSRFDDEKDPMFFLDLVEACPHITFYLVKPRKILTTNAEVMERVNKILEKEGTNLILVDTSNKLSYYNALSAAKVQFNCAHQDWVSWTLLEAVTFKCLPLYPIWKDFPVELKDNKNYLYYKRDLADAVFKLNALLSKTFDDSLSYVTDKHDASWKNYLRKMGFDV